MIETPHVVETVAQLVATIHIETPRSEIQHVMGPGIGEAMAGAKAQGIGPTEPYSAHHLNMTPEAFDFDFCVPVSAPVTAFGRVKPSQRPAITVVRTVYHGPYEELDEAWHEFGAWIEANVYKAAEDLYKAGETLVVWRLDRLGRSLRDLLDISEMLQQRDVALRSLTDHIDTSAVSTSAVGRLFRPPRFAKRASSLRPARVRPTSRGSCALSDPRSIAPWSNSKRAAEMKAARSVLPQVPRCVRPPDRRR